MKKILNPLADPIFKRIFGSEKEILMEFINTFLHLEHPVVSIEFLPLELLSESLAEKTAVVDVRCIDNANRHFIVEIQLSPQKSFRKRALYYLSKIFSRQLAHGDDYEKLEPVYIISLLNFQLFSDFQEGYHSYCMLREQQPKNEIKGFHLIFLELPKLKKSSNFNPTSLQDYWTLFLTEPEKLLDMSTYHLKEYPNLLKAVELLDESKYTPGQLAAYDRYLDSVRTYNDVVKTKIDEGIEIGMEKERNKIISIIEELKKGDKTPEHLALEFNEPIEFILRLKGV